LSFLTAHSVSPKLYYICNLTFVSLRTGLNVLDVNIFLSRKVTDILFNVLLRIPSRVYLCTCMWIWNIYQTVYVSSCIYPRYLILFFTNFRFVSYWD